MKKIAQFILITVVMLMCFFTPVYAAKNETSNETVKINSKENTTQTSNKTTKENSKESSSETLKGQSTGTLLELKTHEAETLEEYKEDYGSDTYGVTAYILDKVRFFSIPLGFIGLAFTGIYQYVIGLKRLDIRDKGFSGMIAIITLMVICQILPLIFAIVVTSAGK